jgi:DNA-binding GntR family transcriptional regulator
MDGVDSRDGQIRVGVHDELRARLLTGRITPETPLSTRRLALEMGVSQMPVRDALGRLAADGAVEIRSKRRIMVPAMTRSRHADLLACRQLLEPAAARQALGALSADAVDHLQVVDDQIGRALENGDVEGYMRANCDFHFTIYRAQPHTIMVQLIETLWLQFGPYMRVVYDRYLGEKLIDQHARAITAIRRNRPADLARAIRQDIEDGMELIRRAGLKDDAP